MALRRTTDQYGRTQVPTRSSATGSPFAVVPPSLLQTTTTSPLPSTFRSVIPTGGQALPGGSTLTRVPWQTVRPWSGQVGGATRVPQALPGGTSTNLFDAFRQWSARSREALPGGGAVAATAGSAAGAGLLDALVAAGPAAGAAGLLGLGTYDQLAGDSAEQYALQEQLPGFSSVPTSPEGTRPTRSVNMNIPGYGTQAVTMPDFPRSFVPDEMRGARDQQYYQERPTTPEPIDYGDGFSDPWADPAAYTRTETGPGGPDLPNIRKQTLDFDFSQYDRLREKSLADALAAINAQYAAQDVGFDAEEAAIGNEYNRLIDQGKIDKRQGIRDVNASGAGRGLLHSGVYAQGMAELLSATSAAKAQTIGAYGEGGTLSRDVESQRNLAEQTQAGDVAGIENQYEKEKLDLEQLQALLRAGMA